MFAAGIITPGQLSRACKGAVSRQLAEKWLAKAEADVLASSLYAVSQCLKVRLTWLVSGEGPAEINDKNLQRAREIIIRLTPRGLAKWFRLGEEMGR